MKERKPPLKNNNPQFTLLTFLRIYCKHLRSRRNNKVYIALRVAGGKLVYQEYTLYTPVLLCHCLGFPFLGAALSQSNRVEWGLTKQAACSHHWLWKLTSSTDRWEGCQTQWGWKYSCSIWTRQVRTSEGKQHCSDHDGGGGVHSSRWSWTQPRQGRKLLKALSKDRIFAKLPECHNHMESILSIFKARSAYYFHCQWNSLRITVCIFTPDNH